MKLSTFNICWLGNQQFAKMTNLKERDKDDWLSIARVISRLDADLIVFEEIVNPEELQNILGLVKEFTAHRYQIYDQNINY